MMKPKTFAVCNEYFKNQHIGASFDYFEFNSQNILCGLIDDVVSHQYLLPLNPQQIIVRVIAFSCNYRDRAIMMENYTKCLSESEPYMFAPIGSEFVAEVIECGSEVKCFKPGDRVIPDCAYPQKIISSGGVVSNFSSQCYHKFNYDQIIKIPDNMSDEKAAAFSIGAQTSYSIIRKARINKNDNILITAATSNTALFALMKLKYDYTNIFAVTTRSDFSTKLKELGVKECVGIEDIENLSSKIGGYDVVIDPFYDLYFSRVLPFMNQQSRYVTCGLYMQHHSFNHKEVVQMNANSVLCHLMLNNISVIGNCIGLRQDLENAINDYESGNYDVIIDNVFTNDKLVDFLDRTYKSKERFGKVVYKYSY